MVTSCDPIFGLPTISQEWLKLELSNFIKRETISSLAKWMINHPQKGRAFAHVTHFCMHNCGLNWDQRFRRLRTIAYRTYGARGHIKGIGLSSIGSICICICCKFCCIVYRLSGVWALSFKYVVITGNNQHFSVCVAICYRPTLVAW